MQEPFDRDKFLNEANIAILATTGPGRRPHAMPIWYLYEDGHFIMSVGADSQKVRNIERQGQAALTIDRRELPYYAVMVRGAAEIGPPISNEMRLRLAVRYLGEERAGVRGAPHGRELRLDPSEAGQRHRVPRRSRAG